MTWSFRAVSIVGQLLLVLATQAEAAEPAPERLALVIGNGAYQEAALPFTHNDAVSMAEALQRAGFGVTRALDLNAVDMQRTVSSFVQQAAGAKVVLVYFAGHGVQASNAKNYLLPVDISPNASEDKIEGGIEVESGILARLGSNIDKRITIVILDACRLPAQSKSKAVDIPFASSSLGGMARIPVPSGTFIAYGTQPGNRAVEGSNSQHGRYTGALLKHIETPGLSLEQVFKRTRSDVETASAGRQSPREESALRGDQDFVFVETGARRKPIAISVVAPSVALSSAAKPAAATSAVASLVASLGSEPRTQRVRALRRLLVGRAMALSSKDVRSILAAYWINVRPRVLQMIEPMMPRLLNADQLGDFMFLFDRADAIEIFDDYKQKQRIGGVDQARLLADGLTAAKANAACAVAEQVKTGSGALSSNVSAARILHELGGGPAMRAGLHELLQRNEVQLSFADAMAVLQGFSPEARAQSFGELFELFPDRLTPDQATAVAEALKAATRPDGEMIQALWWRIDGRLSKAQRLSIATTFLVGAPAEVGYLSYRLNKFCPDKETSLQYLIGEDLTKSEYGFMFKNGQYWQTFNGNDGVEYLRSRPAATRIDDLKYAGFIFKGQFSISDIARVLGDDAKPNDTLRSAIGLMAKAGTLRRPITPAEVSLLRSWFPGPHGDYLLKELGLPP